MAGHIEFIFIFKHEFLNYIEQFSFLLIYIYIYIYIKLRHAILFLKINFQT
jgi:hypothetical protein